MYPEQVQHWKEAALKGYESDEKIQQRLSSRKEDKRKIKKLESELRRKEKALAETAALLVPKKGRKRSGGDEEDV